MARSSFSAGERKLPGAGAVLAAALLGLALACQAPATMRDAAHTPDPSASDPALLIPTLGTKPPAGLVLPTYFAAVTSSDDGSLAVLTTPGSRCALVVQRPSGAIVDAGAATADATGTARFRYGPLADHGRSIQTVTCTFNGATLATSAEVVRP